MSRARKVVADPLKMPGVGASDADWDRWREARRLERIAENAAHPSGYKGPLLRIDGQPGCNQHGHHWSIGQATEMHPPLEHDPLRDGGRAVGWRWGNPWHLAIGALALNDGSWLAFDAKRIKGRFARGDFGYGGGFWTYARRFCTRDAAIRANAAHVIRQVRWRTRWKPGPEIWQRHEPYPGYVIPPDVAAELVTWAMDVAGRPAPVLYVAPPPPPPPPPEPTDLLMWIEQGRQA